MLSFFSFLFIFQIFSTACPKKQLEEEEEEEEEGEGGGGAAPPYFYRAPPPPPWPIPPKKAFRRTAHIDLRRL